ncbi:peptidase s8 s53 subtilisin kexin sedolisin [Fusarium coicis]|nr:peptidase s8 s53 subtilisin kexin sedolisin [Fusarium coicis]
MAESVVTGPCKLKTTTSATSVASTTLVASTTTTLPLSSTTDTTVATIVTGDTETEAATALLTTATAISVGDTTTTKEGTTTAVGETTATTETGTTTADTTTAKAQTTTTTEAETTTAEATTTTAAEPVCSQTLVLANPTPIITDTLVSSDDGNQGFTVPFPIGVFGVSSTSVFVSPNGLLSLDTGSSTYNNNPLPRTNILAVSILPYWDDQYFRRDTCNTGVFYDVYETGRSQTLTVEWHVGSNADTGFNEHYTASFFEDYPGLVRFEYYTITRHGGSATIGVQNG